MKRWRTACIGGAFCGLVAAFAAVAASAPPVASTSAAMPPAPARIRVVTDNNYPPFLFLDGNGKAQGYEVDMWRLFQQHTGIQVELEPMAWDQAQKELLAGKADVIDMLYRTPERVPLYEFSAPYAEQAVGIYVARSIRGITDSAGLRGFPVAVERGDACAEHMRKQGITDLHEYTNYKEIIQLLPLPLRGAGQVLPRLHPLHRPAPPRRARGQRRDAADGGTRHGDDHAGRARRPA